MTIWYVEVGDVVIIDPRVAGGHALRSGAEWYPCAVCIQVEPLVLASPQGDMRWESTLNRTPLLSLGIKVDSNTLAQAMKRLEK